MLKLRLLISIPLFFLLFSSANFIKTWIPAFAGTSFKAKKLILISFDGAQHSLIKSYFESEANQGFGKILKNGFLAEKNIMVTPSLTAVSHISIITGEPPSKTGIVSNSYHRNSDSISQSVRGFTEPIEVETFWEKAMAQGKKVGIISYPGGTAHGNTPEEIRRRKGTWGMPFPESITFSGVKEWSTDQFDKGVNIKIPQPFRTYNIPQVATLTLKDSATDPTQTKKIFLILLDTTNDKIRNYDFLIVDNDTKLSNGVIATASQDEWFKILYTTNGKKRMSVSKVLEINSNPLSLKIYLGSLNQHNAYPEAFLNLLETKLEPPPSGPDHSSIHKTLTEEDYFLQASRFSEYLHKVINIGLHEMDWDIVLLYIPITDEVGQQFYLTSPRQKGFEDQEKVKQYASYLRQGYEFANTVVNDLIQYVDNSPENIALVAVSDHGMAPLHSFFYPNRVLTNNGYIKNSEGLSYEARAFSSGGASHVYLNLKDREKNGIMEPADYEKYQMAMAKIFATLKNSSDEPILNHVLVKPKDSHEKMPCIIHQDEKFDLNHPTNTGDIVLIANPGYHLVDTPSGANIIEPSDFFGQHGYDPHHPAMAGIFYAYSKNIPPTSVESISALDIFPMLSNMLDLNLNLKNLHSKTK